MSLRKRFRDFRGWCPQPAGRLNTKVVRHSMPIAVMLTTALILSTSLFAFSSGVLSISAVSAVSLDNSQTIVGSFVTNPLAVTSLWTFNSFENYQTNVNILTVNDGLVYALVFDDTNVKIAYCLNAATGNQVWSNPQVHYTMPFQRTTFLRATRLSHI